jgi:hypothetical protein
LLGHEHANFAFIILDQLADMSVTTLLIVTVDLKGA